LSSSETSIQAEPRRYILVHDIAAAHGLTSHAVSETPVLEASGVSKRYGDRHALCGVDLIARRGQLHGLLGPNGAGKTTLMRVLLGLIRRDAGNVRILGREVGTDERQVADGVAGFVETPAFYPYLTGRRNLTLFARLDNAPKAGRAERIDNALEQTGLTAEADRTVGGYSAGMRQRLGVAAALLRSPQLLFLDEPTSSLDPAGARDVRAIARRLADEGAAVVLSSHDMSEVEELCTALTVVNHGRVIFSGTVDGLRALAPAAIHALRTADDGRAIEIAAEQRGVRVVPAVEGGLEVSAAPDALDAYVIALGRAGVAVRGLERRARSLESLFLELTASAAPETEPVASSDDTGNASQQSLVLS
jgi:ABC-2 type transport system ATP-binding protein